MATIKITKIPPIKDVALKVLLFDIADPQSGSEAMLNLISKDKGIASSVLKTANSAFFGRRGQVHSLKDAITLLGLRTVKMMVIAEAQRDFLQILSSESLRRYLHKLPLVSAFVSIDLSRPLELQGVQKDDLFVGALFRDLGMSVLAMNAPKEYAGVLERLEAGESDLIALERSVFEADHLMAGAKIAEMWKLPAQVAELMGRRFSASEAAQVDDLGRCVMLANHVSARLLGCVQPAQVAELAEALLAASSKGPALLEPFDEDYLALLMELPFFQAG